VTGSGDSLPAAAEDPAAEARELLRRRLADGPDAWFVGGTVRERLAGRTSDDLDVAIAGDDAARTVARAVARDAGAHAFPLSDAFGAWRVVANDDAGRARWQIDLTPLQGDDLAADLARRDLTVNAIAEPVRGGALVDPHGGRDDLAAGRLRMVGPDAFAADPVRVVRLARFAAELGFAADDTTVTAARASSRALADVPGERLRPELERLLAAPAWLVGWRVLLASGAGAVLFPAAVDAGNALRPATERALRALVDGTATVPEATADDRARLAARAADRERRLTLALALLGLDGPGADATLGRLRPSRRLRTVVVRTRGVVETLRDVAAAGGDVDRLDWWRALRPLGPDGPDAVLVARVVLGSAALPWAWLLACAVRWADAPPRSPVRGDRLAEELGIPLGPEIGSLLERLTLDADAGTVTSPEQAIARARVLRADRGGSDGDG
jgi:hypothetical protein